MRWNLPWDRSPGLLHIALAVFPAWLALRSINCVSSNAPSRAERSTNNVVRELNFRVRNGFGCFPSPMTADRQDMRHSVFNYFGLTAPDAFSDAISESCTNF